MSCTTSEGLTRSVLKQILAEAQITGQRRRGRGGSVLLFPADAARNAIASAFGPGRRNRLAYNCGALRISAAAKATRVTRGEIEDAVEAGELEAHLVRNGAKRFLPEDLDRWSATRSSIST